MRVRGYGGARNEMGQREEERRNEGEYFAESAVFTERKECRDGDGAVWSAML